MHIQSYITRIKGIFNYPANQGHWLDLLKRTLALRLAILENRPVEFEFLNHTRIRCLPDTFGARDLAYYRVPDYRQMAFIEAFLRPGDNVVDVGANIGLYTVLAASLVRPGGRLDSVEAVPTTARRLLENVALNKLNAYVKVHQLAVGSNDDWVEFTADQDAANHTVTSDTIPDRLMMGTRIKVPASKIDDIAKQPLYALGKIDIEGRECDAFRGAIRLLESQSPPIWIVEINGALFRYSHQVSPFISWLGDYGYAPYSYEPSSKELRQMRDDAWGDVFFVARDKKAFVKERIPGLSFVD